MKRPRQLKPFVPSKRTKFTTFKSTTVRTTTRRELKYQDSFLDAFAVPASADWTGTEADPATANTLFVCTTGAAINNRIGQQVFVTKLKLRGYIYTPKQANQTSTDTASMIRLIVFQDTRTNAAQCQGEDLMASSGSANRSLVNFQNVNNFGRFIVLKDKMIILANPNLAWDGTNMEQQSIMKTFKFNIKFKKPVSVRFNGTNGGTVADIIDNSFHVIATTNNVDLTPTMYYQCRTVFHE